MFLTFSINHHIFDYLCPSSYYHTFNKPTCFRVTLLPHFQISHRKLWFLHWSFYRTFKKQAFCSISACFLPSSYYRTFRYQTFKVNFHLDPSPALLKHNHFVNILIHFILDPITTLWNIIHFLYNFPHILNESAYFLWFLRSSYYHTFNQHDLFRITLLPQFQISHQKLLFLPWSFHRTFKTHPFWWHFHLFHTGSYYRTLEHYTLSLPCSSHFR